MRSAVILSKTWQGEGDILDCAFGVPDETPLENVQAMPGRCTSTRLEKRVATRMSSRLT